MTAIKEYPFDLSDLNNQTESRPTAGNVTNTLPVSTTPDGKRKVSIMANEGSKDRENLPSER